MSYQGPAKARDIFQELFVDYLTLAGKCMLLANIFLVCVGSLVGVLVLAGQGSKSGSLEVLTAIALFSDVAFKVITTVIVEAIDYSRYLLVQRNLWRHDASRDARQEQIAAASTSGQPLEGLPSGGCPASGSS